MRGIQPFAVAVFLAGVLPALAGIPPEAQSLTQLKQRLAAIDAELHTLAHFSLRSGVGAIGYRSRAYPRAEDTSWVGIDFGKQVPLDEVVLVPTIWRDAEQGFRSDGFPQAFRIRAGAANDREGEVIAEVRLSDDDLPRLAPLVIATPGVTASWIRVETLRMTTRSFDEAYVFQLAELLAFSGEDNVALQKPITTSANQVDNSVGWDLQFLTDGLVPYLMNSAQGQQSTAYLSPVDVGRRPFLSIDLEQSYPLFRLRLHAVDQDDTVPQASPDNIGVPHHFRIEGSTKPDFSDAIRLLDVRRSTIYDVAPVMTWPLPETPCRYIRLIAVKPYVYSKGYEKGSQLGFAEIELLSGGQNVARGKQVTTSYTAADPNRPVSKLTDGHNLFGEILPSRAWFTQLARRHDLETERPIVAEELNRRYARQIANLRRTIGLAALLVAAVGFAFLIDRIFRMRQLARVKERFAADLHDELGANLHTIGLLSDLAEGSKDNPDEVTMLHRRIRAVTERTGTALRNCTNMLEAKGLYTDLISDMRRAAQRIMADFDHDMTIEGTEHLTHLKPRTCVDLFLFYKECLVNVSRHSGANIVSTRLIAGPRNLELTILDNGRGISTGFPSSLKRRARLLGAKVDVGSPIEGGTRVTLKLKTRRFGVL